MKKVSLIIWVVFLPFFCFAQEEKEAALTKTWTLNFVVVGAGLVGEFPVGEQVTLRLETGGVFGINPQINNLSEFEVGIGFTPYALANFRYFYQLKKNTSSRRFFYNSGDFVFAQINGYTPPVFSTDSFDFRGRVSAGIGWGFQRVFSNKFVLSLGGGFGYYWPQNSILPIGDLTLGILLRPTMKK